VTSEEIISFAAAIADQVLEDEDLPPKAKAGVALLLKLAGELLVDMHNASAALVRIAEAIEKNVPKGE
jgi:hypothetical protein